MNTETNATIEDLAHEAWAAAQLAPGEGIEDAVRRIAGLITAALDSQARQIEELTAERDTLKHGHRSQLDAATPAPGEWVEWQGGEVAPVADGVRHEVRLRDGRELFSLYAGSWIWSVRGIEADIVAYRVAA